MLTNKAFAVAAVAALAEPAVAFNSHRHLHHQLDKRAMETDWVTVYETVYVTAGQELPAPTSDVPVDVVPSDPAPTSSSITSTTTIVVEPSPEPTQEEEEEVEEGAPAPIFTTLVTSAKPPAPSPIDEETSVAPVLNPIQPEPTTSVVEQPQEPEPAPTTSEVEEPEQPEETSSPSPPSGSPVSGKRGIAYNDAGMADAFSSSCESCSWAYNWASSRGDLSSAVDFVPMLWGDAPLHTSHWDSDCENELANGVKALFSFNEPDHASQANISPAQAADSHIKWMNKYAGRALIGAPSVTNSGQPGEGLEWLQGFVDACDASSEGCSYDFCNVHWYSEAQYSDTLFEHLQKANEICGGKPVWLTEFAPLGSDEQISEFMTNIIPELDNVEYLEAYSYFMVSAGSLMSSSTSLSGYGQIYASV